MPKHAATIETAQTLCEQGGQELLPFVIFIKTTDSVVFQIYICKANANVRVWLENTLLVDQEGVSHFTVRVPIQTVGQQILRWAILAAGANWQARSEVAVNDVTRFRHRKGAASNNPVNHFFVALQPS